MFSSSFKTLSSNNNPKEGEDLYYFPKGTSKALKAPSDLIRLLSNETVCLWPHTLSYVGKLAVEIVVTEDLFSENDESLKSAQVFGVARTEQGVN